MTYRFRALVFAACVLAAACERRGESGDERIKASRALRGAVTYPGSSIISVSAGSEAAELVMSSPDSVDRVVGWFRRALPLNQWVIKTDTRDLAGTATIYAERDRRPLWLTLQSNVGGAGTTYKLVGVFAVDSSRTASPPSR